LITVLAEVVVSIVTYLNLSFLINTSEFQHPSEELSSDCAKHDQKEREQDQDIKESR
jgi:hypothetical protein